MDNGFEILHDALRYKWLTLITTADDEHVPKIKRQTKVVKEQVRITWNLLPYQKPPNIMIYRIVENAVFWLNTLPVNSRMSFTVFPWTLMKGTTIDFKKQCKTEFGAYAEAHKNIFPCNSTQSRTEPATCHGPT